MTLSTGTKLSHYEITSLLGRGGMGEVYQAKDQKLGRDVAIKVLPEEFARDTERVARFQREAKLLASLNHPNIAAIYGLEESDGTHFLVLELVEGNTLADQIKKGPIPVEESLKLALQIAEALEAAHEKGVIHRDLKPANIKVTPDGKVKVLDFGLAKAFAGEQAEVNLSHSPALSEAATLQGVILGTAAYMSPEQARGKPVDKRTDIWAFGCVLYEMLTGKAAFQGEDVTEILAAVVKSGVDLDLLPTNIHPRVREVLTRCLQKDMRIRYSGIGDARYEIEQVLADPSGVFVQPVTVLEPRTRMRLIFPWIAAALVLGAIVAGLAVWKMRAPEPPQVTRFSYQLADGLKFGKMDERAIAVSPDGRQLVFSTSEGLYLRSLYELDAKLVAGTNEAPENPFFSPDGKWIGYWSRSESQLKKIPISGGVSKLISDQGSVGFINWGADGMIVYAQGGNVMRVSANGGEPELLAESSAGSTMIVAPQILPDGKSVMFTHGPSQWKIIIQSLESGDYKELFDGDHARYLPTGHIVYGADNNLFAVPFDLDKLEPLGEPFCVVEGIFRDNALQYSVSESGTLAYIPETSKLNPEYTLVWVNKEGEEEPLKAPPKNYSQPRISPDSDVKRLAVAIASGGIGDVDIWIYDFIRENITPFALHRDLDSNPLWTPDAQRIVFESERNGVFRIYWQQADGAEKSDVLGSARDRIIIPASLTPDGKTLVLQEITLGPMQSDIALLSMDGDGIVRPLLNEKYNERGPQLSHDGHWIAYTSDESGRNEIYVRPFPEVDEGKQKVSTNGGTEPLWSPDGRELFYRNGDEVIGVEVEKWQVLSFGNPKILFRGNYNSCDDQNYATIGMWDISPDGKRFLMIKPTSAKEDGPQKINIVLNWFEELKERVPVE